MCVWWPEVNVGCGFQRSMLGVGFQRLTILFLRHHLSLGLGAHQLGYTGQLTSPSDPPFSTSLALDSKLVPPHPAFTRVLGKHNTGPHGYTVSTLWTDPSPKPKLLLL